MSYEDALADLKADFGKKKLLTPAAIAPYISKSPSAQASMRPRKQFPIAKKDMGGCIVVSIYALAKYIGEDNASPDAPEQIRVASLPSRLPRLPRVSTRPSLIVARHRSVNR